jgi:hypothetical protein
MELPVAIDERAPNGDHRRAGLPASVPGATVGSVAEQAATPAPG